MPKPQIFLDCDGVLADFDLHARGLFGMCPRLFEKRAGSTAYWNAIRDDDRFYYNTPLMPDAIELVDAVRHLDPIILTGAPLGTWAEPDKLAWGEEHFPGIPMIVCRAANKRDHAQPGDVLIDDWPQHRHRWIEHGGIFISHYDAKTSLETLWAHYPDLRP